uniref:Uncharacterized protein n=1 Tax=Anguilla anguilla TaxID=7936 RepID=A0A0E9TSP9_ANGAN
MFFSISNSVSPRRRASVTVCLQESCLFSFRAKKGPKI